MAQEDHGKMNEENDPTHRGPWGHIIRGMWRSPVGLMGVTITTVSATLLVIGVVFDLFGFFKNPYAGFFTYLVLPAGMVIGLLLIPFAAYLRRRKWYKYGISREHLKLNLSDHRHRRWVVFFMVATVINICILAIVGYEGYHFTESPYFCGKLCHTVMEPEYTAYKRSPHAKIKCAECHIGPGASWFVRSKISGLRQVAAVATDSYSRPIPTPVEELRPARDTCEECHWPEKFYGKKVKEFYSFSNNDQQDPEIKEISLHIGGHNPKTEKFEGIHWHVSNNVEVSYLPADEERTKIPKVRVERADGSVDEYVREGMEIPEAEEGEKEHEWRVMDCIDCHNRPTHRYDMPKERVDFGLLSKRINREIPGIREDSLQILNKEYPTREEAKEKMIEDLLSLQKNRNAEQAVKYEEDIREAGQYLLETYLNNIWPGMNISWGTYKSHIGHQQSEEGYGCFRCHDSMHLNEKGESITQDCTLCHDSPF
ncbi:MAG: NapC/NirT family cytochrome c [Desulfurivibrionaceae bacterium]